MDSNNIFLFREGYPDKSGNHRYISYTPDGKVIISKECSKSGYYRIVELVNKPNCMIAVDMIPVNYDYYPGIEYSDFKKLLLERGYSISFEMPFKWKKSNTLYDEIRLVAYSIRLNMVIVADTMYGKTHFYGINCYCYGVNSLLKRNKSRLLFTGSYKCAVYDLTCALNIAIPPLRLVEKLSCKDTHVVIDKSDIPQGYTYCDKPASSDDYVMYSKKFHDLCSPELRDYLYGVN